MARRPVTIDDRMLCMCASLNICFGLLKAQEGRLLLALDVGRWVVRAVGDDEDDENVRQCMYAR